MRRLRPWLLFAACITATPALALDVPYLSGRVVDNAEILSPAARERITQQLKAHEDASTNQIAVLTVPALEGDSIEDFAVRVFEEWKLGGKEADNGVLVVVAPQDRRMRIEVGYGLEGTLTDVVASRIIRDVMTPRFKAGDFDGGVEQGVQAIVQVLNGGAAEWASAPSPQQESEFFEGPPLSLPERILFGGFIFGIIGLFTLIGIMTPGVGWFLYFFLIPFWSMFPIVVVGVENALKILVVYLVGYPLLKLILRRTEWYKRASKSTGMKGGGGFGGFSVGSGGGSWSSGGGGFSGGGGSSGGGGASGGW
jgi:uncharacterized protein